MNLYILLDTDNRELVFKTDKDIIIGENIIIDDEVYYIYKSIGFTFTERS